LLNSFKEIWLGDEAMGYLETYENDELVNITEIHINPAAQGKGVGSRIINGIVNEAKAHGKKVTLGCFKENDGAVKLYQRLGFEITDETQTHFALEHS
jgi:ribosomal protein S18 acetylase RimI-like enzyme